MNKESLPNLDWHGLRIGFALTGSFCTLAKAVDLMADLKEKGAVILPIISDNVANTDSRFGSADYWRKRIIESSCSHNVVDSIPLAEPIGPQDLLDIMLICPCSGNTLAKLAFGITDTPVLMATKSHLRGNKPVVLALSSNDGLANNAKNIGALLNYRNIYFVPFGQDDPERKPNSLTYDIDLVEDTLLTAYKGKQIQPILRQYR